MTLARDIEVVLHFLTAEESGREGPVRSEYPPQFYYDGHDWDAVHEYPDKDLVYPGETVRAYLSFLSPECHQGKLNPGMKFKIRDEHPPPQEEEREVFDEVELGFVLLASLPACHGRPLRSQIARGPGSRSTFDSETPGRGILRRPVLANVSGTVTYWKWSRRWLASAVT